MYYYSIQHVLLQNSFQLKGARERALYENLFKLKGPDETKHWFKSKELLRETDMKINEIAERVGYQPFYFIRIFKKMEGLTPGQYRESADDGPEIQMN